MTEALPEHLRPTQYRSLHEVLTHVFNTHAHLPAFTCLGRTLSYAELDALSSRFARYLVREAGLQAGDRIAIQLPNLLQLPVALFGAIKAGLVVVNTNPLYTPPEMRHQFRDSGVKAIVILDGMCSKLESILTETAIETVIVTRLGDLQKPGKRQLLNFAARYVKKMVPPYDLPDAVAFNDCIAGPDVTESFAPPGEGDDVALILYTGGTTGVAKGAMLSHNNLIANMMQLWARCLMVMNDQVETLGAPLPLYHSYAFLFHCLAMPYGGNHNILVPDPRNLKALVGLWKKYGFTGFVGINTLYQALLRYPAFDNVDFTPLKFCGAGGMAMSSSVMAEWQKRTGRTLFEGYGLTECSPVVTVNVPGRIKAGTVGPLVPETEARVVDDTGKDVAAGDKGELWVRGPQVMLGYWQQPEATAEAVTDAGWFKTGDYATIDDEGFIRIVDRKKDMILVSGFNVFPNEIEDWVDSHPQVLESAAIGIPDERTGEAVKLFVVKGDEALTREILIKHCKAGLTAYKIPGEVEFVSELPKSNVGKVIRRKLRDQ